MRKPAAQTQHSETPLERLDRSYQEAAEKTQRIAAIAADFDAEEIGQAILAQEPMMTRRILDVGGSRSDVDEAMSDLAQHVYNSLPNYVKRGNVPLVQWVTGVAKNRLQEFARTAAQARTQSTSYIDEFAHDVVTMDPFEDDDDFLVHLIKKVRQSVVSQPGGIAEWERITRMAQQPKRGRAARDALREHMATVSGLPVTSFGSDIEVESDESPVTETQPVFTNGKFHLHCSQCGTLPEGYDNLAELQAQIPEHSHD